MAEPITTAGTAVAKSSAPNSRKDSIKAVRAILRNATASDAEVDDALEALVELSKD